jgi:twitching motility protein PilT
MPKLDAFFKTLKEKKGSDLHLSPGNPPLMRTAGEIVTAATQKLTHEENQALLYETAI